MTTQLDKRPEPIQLTNAFAYDTMSERVPGILREIIAKNPDYPPTIVHALTRLHDDLQSNAPIPMLDAHPVPPPDFDAWAAAYRAQQARVQPLTWLHGDWFFAETFLYRHVIQAVRWHETGRDPFAPNKHAAYVEESLWNLLATALTLDGSPEDRLHDLLSIGLWGNRADLSHPAGTLASDQAAHDDLLADDRPHVVRYLAPGAAAGDRRPPVHIIADNAGTELVMDLVLADCLLAETGSPVVMQLKAHPTFVSDATIADVWYAIRTLARHEGAAAALAQRLRAAWSQRRLFLVAPSFWTSSRFLWDMPADLYDVFSRARLVILKGDMNYRRAMGDVLWPLGTAFEDVMRYFPAPVVALRSSKSDTLAGVPAARVRQLDAHDDSWRVTGQYGMIQFSMPERTP